MTSFLNAVSFLTVLRIPGNRRFDGAKSLVWFPVVGLLIGAFLVGVRYAVASTLGDDVAPVMTFVAMVLVSGGLHLDGLADTADGLFSHKTRDEMLVIMKDSRTGAMGVIAIAVILFVKYDGLTQDIPDWVLLFAPAYARIAQVAAMTLLPYARSEGTARAFFGQRNIPGLLAGLGVIIASMVAAPAMGVQVIEVIVFAGTALAVFAGMMILFYRRIGGITGDMVGALTEVMEAALLIVLAGGGLVM